MNSAIASERLANQSIAVPRKRTVASLVSWLGAAQAQEYGPAKWGLALRTGATDAAIERAFDEGRILRTHILRPTWHFVTPEDIRWMLDLTAPHIHRTMATYERNLELDARTLTRATKVFERALSGGEHRTRAELGALVNAKGQRLAHMAAHAELEGVICSGRRVGKTFTYALLDLRAPHAKRLSRDEALAELVRRYFRSHGPATVRDFSWWSGLTMRDAKRGLEINHAKSREAGGLTYWTIGAPPRSASPDGVHLLPIYDEYLVAYRDRVAVPHPALPKDSVIFQHALIIDGQVAGTWRMTNGRVAVFPLERLSGADQDRVARAVARREAWAAV